MNKQIGKVLFVVGPTASGKTDLALDLARIFSGELVNADSKQVYQGVDIIPGKDLPPQTDFVTHNFSVDSKYCLGYYTFGEVKLWLLDVVTPQEEFNVFDYLNSAPLIINHILDTDKTPVVVGGSGFYVKGLLDGIGTLSIPQDEILRKNFLSASVEKLTEVLENENSEQLKKMNASDRQNKRRLVRAIEIARFNQTNAIIPRFSGITADVKVYGLQVDREVVKTRIDRRVKKRIEQGAIDEAMGLFHHKDILSSTVMSINGLKPLFDYFDNKISFEEAIERWKVSEYLNAKKQITWFKRDNRVTWYDISDKDFKKRVVEDTEKWIHYANKY